MSPLNKSQLRSLYGKRARYYDITANAYYMIGFRETAYRKKAVDRLRLHRGDTVIDVCCGTGLNFQHLINVVGKEGKVIGVDLTKDMLDQAGLRVERNRWRNVELVHCDASEYTFPDHINGVFSSFAITLVPEYDEIIQQGAAALIPGGRCVILDFKIPSNALALLAPIAILITRPFGVSPDLSDRHPWESVRRYCRSVTTEELYGGFAYIVTGEK